MKQKLYPIAVALVLCIPANVIFGQLGHYWTHQYGVRSTLLGNSVIGSVVDLGAVYYNPARLAVIEEPAFLLSADIYEWTKLKFEDAFSEGKSLKQSGFGNAPGFAAGTFNVKFLPNHRFAYAIMGRERTSVEARFRQEIERDVFPEVAGDELFGAGINFDFDSRTRWYSLAWAYPFSEKFGVGVTMTGSQTSANRKGDIDLQALAESGEVGVYRFSRKFSLRQEGILWKIGLAGQFFDKLEWGLTVTTPTIKLRGRGDYSYEEYLSNLEELPEEDRFSSSTQSDLELKVKTPLSVGLGVAVPVGRARIHFSTEWYSGLSDYLLMESMPHESQSSGDTTSLRLRDNRKSVINFGLGFDYDVSEKLQLFASLNSDFSSVDGDVTSFVENVDEVSYSGWTADFWHYSAGASFAIKTAELTLGFSQTHARQKFARPIDFPDNEGEVGFSTDEPGVLRWSRLQLIFGFSVNLNDLKWVKKFKSDETVPDNGESR